MIVLGIKIIQGDRINVVSVLTRRSFHRNVGVSTREIIAPMQRQSTP